MPSIEHAKSSAGRMAYHGGLAAETSVERRYATAGFVQRARRWRGKSGEIDLIFAARDGLVFVEVKKARGFDQAATRISPSQRARIFAAASEFVADEPAGQLTRMRFDVALFDASGEIRIVRNALFCD